MILENVKLDCYWYYVLRMYFYTNRIKYYTNWIFTDEKQWLKDVQNKDNGNHTDIINGDVLLKILQEVSVLILSSNLRDRDMNNYAKIITNFNMIK